MIVVMAAGAGLMLAACSSSGGSGSSTGTGGASGSPIGLMMITATGAGNPGDSAIPGTKAAVEDVNAAGGIKGRPLKLTICDTHANPNQASACAQKALSDSSIVATVGDNDYTGGGPITGVLNGKMAAIAHKQFTPADFAAPAAFPTDCGGVGISAGMAEWLAIGGSKHIVALVYDNAGGQNVVSFLGKQLGGLFPNTKLTSVPIPLTATDMTSYAAQALDEKPDGIMLALPQSTAVGAITQLRAQGYTGKIQASSTVLSPSAIEQLGDTAGVQATGCYAYESKGYAAFVAGMAKYQPSADKSDEAINGWIGVHALTDVMSTSSQPLTRAGVLAAFKATSNLSTDGVTAPIDFTKDTGVTGFERAFAPTAVNHEIVDGKLTDVKPSQFVNILTGKIVT